LAAQLRLIGVDVWLDDWEIAAGRLDPGKVNEALIAVDTVLVLWSENAARSRWVDAELATALDRHLRDGSVQLIPIRLDDAELPALLQPHKSLRLEVREDVPTSPWTSPASSLRGVPQGDSADDRARRPAVSLLPRLWRSYRMPSMRKTGARVGALACDRLQAGRRVCRLKVPARLGGRRRDVVVVSR
jgi:TIR domain